MKTFHIRVYVGPILVAPMACKFRAAGLKVTVEGTEHIHVIIDCPDEHPRYAFLNRLRSTHGSKFGLDYRDIEVIRQCTHVTESAIP